MEFALVGGAKRAMVWFQEKYTGYLANYLKVNSGDGLNAITGHNRIEPCELLMDKCGKTPRQKWRGVFLWGYCAEASQTLPEAVPSLGGLKTSTAIT